MTDHHTITDRDTQPGTLTDARANLPGRGDTGRVGTERSCPGCGTCFTPHPRQPPPARLTTPLRTKLVWRGGCERGESNPQGLSATGS